MRTSKPASAASRAASTRSGRDTLPNSGPTRMPARRSSPLPASKYEPSAGDHLAGPGPERRELDPVFAVGPAEHRARAELLQDHAAEVLSGAVRLPRFPDRVDEVVFLIDEEGTMGRQRLDRERTGDPDLRPVLVGLVVQVLEIGLRGDRLVNLPSAGPY